MTQPRVDKVKKEIMKTVKPIAKDFIATSKMMAYAHTGKAVEVIIKDFLYYLNKSL